MSGDEQDDRDLPRDFEDSAGRPCVLADLRAARYELELLSDGEIGVRSVLDFVLDGAGHVVFDLVPEPRAVAIVDDAGARIDARAELVPFGEQGRAPCRVLDHASPPGPVRLAVEHGIRWNGGPFVTSMTDQRERGFLERWLPTGFEHDRYAATMSIHAATPSIVFSNGQQVVEAAGRRWEITFPPTFNCSSFFVVLGAEGSLDAHAFEHAGVEITMLAHPGSHPGNLARLRSLVIGHLERLSQLFAAPLPTRRLLLLAHGTEGMEYAGAAEIIRADRAVFHELAHQYIGRFARPASGRSGWFDEAVAEWMYFGCSEAEEPSAAGSLSGHAWQRSTPSDGYKRGCDVLGHANSILRDSGGLIRLVRALAARDRIIGRASIRAAWDAAGGDEATQAKMVALWNRCVDGPSTERERVRTMADETERARPIRAALEKIVGNAEQEEEFQADPEGQLQREHVDDEGQRVVMTLDPYLISAFVRAEEELSPDDTRSLRDRLIARLDPEVSTHAAAWPHPEPRIAAVEPTSATGAFLRELRIRGAGLMNGSLVRLVQLDTNLHPHPHGARRDWRGTVEGPAEYTNRTLRVRDLDLRGLPPGRYELTVRNSLGLPPVRAGSAFVIT